MSEACNYKNPLRRDGTSQRQRSPAALAPSSVAVDERELSDLLLYSKKHARLLRYYGPDNHPAGDWTDFLEHDPTTVAAAVAETDPESFRKAYESLLEAVADAPEADKAAKFAELVPPLLELARTFELWYRGSVEGLSLRHALERLIGSVLRDALRAAIAAARRAEELSLPVEEIDTGEWSDVWELSETVEADKSFFPSGKPLDDEELEDATGRMGRIFERFYEALVFLTGEAPAHLEETLTDYPRHPPQMALLLAFLRLLEHARDHLNTLTAAHLDFYYRTVLGLEPRDAEPDRVHLLFELAKRFESHLLAEDTVLKAGKDDSGVELLYATDEEIAVNRARLDDDHGLKTVFVDKDEDGVVQNVYAAPDADSADGLGAEIDDEEGKWEGLGSTAMPYAEIGFAVASPMLLLGEGDRTITLTFVLTPESPVADLEIKGVKAYASGAEQWLTLAVEKVATTTTDPDGNPVPSLVFELSLAAAADAVVAYDDEVLGDGFDTSDPVVKLLFDNESAPYPYQYFRELEVELLKIFVDVDGVRELILENDLGVLNPAKPFYPFGPSPKKGGSFLIGSPEVFLKPVKNLELTLQWADLPEENFADHYQRYTKPDPNDPNETLALVDDNEDFTATWGVLQGGKWQTLQEKGGQVDSVTLFLDEDENDQSSAPSSSREIGLELPDPDPPLPRNTGGESFERFAPGLRQGFLRATLERSFLHGLYPKVLAEEASGGGTDLPNPPYTPLMASLALGYEARTTLDKNDFEDRVGRIFQIGPFGHREVHPIDDDDRKLVPAFDVTVKAGDGSSEVETAEGTLLIGLAELDPPQNLTLLFQVAEGSEDPLATPQEISWSYLADDRWVDFETSEVLSDSTDSLLSSGIVRLATPKAMTPAKTILPAGLYWIKASVAEQSAAVPKLIAVHTQAVVASFRDQGNEASRLASALPAETIAKLKNRAAAVKSVLQPYASFDGRMEEDEESFYVRVSERLRHKGRAVTIYDYERLVLESFPEVYKVRCLNHTAPGCELAPGSVLVVAVANLRNKNAVDPLEPRLSLAKLESIRRHLVELSSDFVILTVANPSYEKVRVRFNVRFYSGRDKGLYTRKLDEDIVGFLSPWLVDEAADVALGGRVHRSAILDFVENRDYVDFVTDFEMDHIVDETTTLVNVEQAEATRASAALVSAPSHQIAHSAFTCRDLEV